MEPFFNGTQPDGGYWLDMSRLSAHNHTGGLNGAPVSAVIPPGSITSGQLDPSVLAPYALTDGSKPFTGQVTMQADAIIRDALFFGEQGTALAPDVTLTRTAPGRLRVDTHLGVGVNPAASSAGHRALQLGGLGFFQADATATGALTMGANIYWEGSGWRTLAAGPAVYAQVHGNGSFNVATAPSVGAGGTPVPTTRASIAPTGTLTLTPDAGVDAIDAPGVGGLRLHSQLTPLYLTAHAVGVMCSIDNFNALGDSTHRWNAVYAVNGVIQTSSQEMKEGITPLSPERAMQAVRDTEAVTFDYVAPTRGPEWYDLPDDPEQAEAVLQQRLTAAPLEAAARHQHGFVAEQADELFLVGEGQTSPGSSIGVLLAALQQLDQRVQSLEGAA
jgi:hypothetical protein